MTSREGHGQSLLGEQRLSGLPQGGQMEGRGATRVRGWLRGRCIQTQRGQGPAPEQEGRDGGSISETETQGSVTGWLEQVEWRDERRYGFWEGYPGLWWKEEGW